MKTQKEWKLTFMNLDDGEWSESHIGYFIPVGTALSKHK
jgi:hypothetical protein